MDDLHLCPAVLRLDVPAARSAHRQVSGERTAVEALLRKSEHPIYGFTTLLGHLDDISSGSSSQNDLLDAHLVGPPHSLSYRWGRLLLATKIHQIAAGGTGIDPATYTRLVDAFDAIRSDDEPWTGAWDASYGSGDVVPGAWFVSNLLDRFDFMLSSPGDLISLINGNFVSTSVAFVADSAFARAASRSYSLLRAARSHVDSQRESSSPQLPVSLRDLSPIHRQVTEASALLDSALNDRISRPSCNPLFSEVDGELTAISQSSFLDFGVTGAATVAQQACCQMGAYLKAAIHTRETLSPRDSRAPVQPTKVAQSILNRMQAESFTAPAQFALAESNSVEDVCDMSLVTCLGLISTCNELSRLADLATTELSALGIDSGQGPDCRHCRNADSSWELGSLADELLTL